MFHVEHNVFSEVLARPKDHLVSQKKFQVVLDAKRRIAKTEPFPPPQSIHKYYASSAYISHGNQKKSVLDRFYAVAQHVMFFQKHRWMSKHKTQRGSYLDFGCGSGELLRYLSHKGWKTTGIEPSAQAREFAGHPENVFACLEDLPQKKFDIIALWHVLEHLYSPSETISQLEKRLANDGLLVIALPNFRSWDADYYGDYWAAYDVPRHLWHFSKEGLIALFAAKGLHCKAVYPMKLDAFYVSYLSSQHQQKPFAFLRGIFNGLRSNLHALRTQEYSSNVFVFSRD